MKRLWSGYGIVCVLFVASALFIVGGCATGQSSGTPYSAEPSVYVADRSCDVRQLAVLPFKASTELIGSSFSDIFGTRLLRTGRYKLVERSQIAGVLGETELSMSGLSDSAAIAAGKMVGADGVVLGTVDEYTTIAYKGRTYPVVGASVRMIDCETGQVLWSVGYSRRSTDRMDTLSGHARRVADQMVGALRAKWHVQPQTKRSAGSPQRQTYSHAVPAAYTPTAASQAGGAKTGNALPPPAPDFSVSDLGLREVVVQWPPPPGTYRIRIERSARAGGPFTAVATVDAGRGQYCDSGTETKPLEDGATYYYRLVTLDDAGRQSQPTIVKESMTAPPPAQVKSVSAESGQLRCVQLTWEPSQEAEVTLYRIERRAEEDVEWNLVAEVNGRESSRYLDGGRNPGSLPDATAFAYRVCAVNSVGAQGQPSVPVTARTHDRPPMVLAFRAEAGLPRKIALRWMASEDEMVDRYHIYRSETGGDFKQIATVTGRTTELYVDEGNRDHSFFGGNKLTPLASGGEYLYRILAVNPAGAASEIPAEARAVTKPLPATPGAPAAVSGLAGRITLQWSAPESDDVSGYVVMAGDAAAKLDDICKTSDLHYSDTGLQPSRQRFYSIRVVDGDGLESLPSAPVAATTKPLPDPPTDLTAKPSEGGWSLAWQPPPQQDVVKYRLWEKRFLGKSDMQTVESNRAKLQAEEVGRKIVVMVQSIDADGLESDMSEAVAIRGQP